MKVSEIYGFIDSFAPFCTQEPWENSGVLFGCPDNEADRILVCLDITQNAVKYAAEMRCGLIVSHHPLIFHPLKQIPYNSAITALIKNDICVISAHTNLDKAPGGVNDTLCELLGMDYEKADASFGGGFLNVGTLKNCKTGTDLANHLHQKLHGAVRFNSNNSIGKIAVCAGAGGEFYADAKAAGCNTLITGDADHHDFLDAAEAGVALFAAGHYETEIPIVYKLAASLERQFLKDNNDRQSLFADNEPANAAIIVYPYTNSINTITEAF